MLFRGKDSRGTVNRQYNGRLWGFGERKCTDLQEQPKDEKYAHTVC